MSRLLPGLSFFILPAVALYAQTAHSKAQLSAFSISLPGASNENLRQFSGITVLDLRYDTIKIGFAHDKQKYKILQMDGGLQRSVQNYLENSYSTKNTSLPHLLIVVRNFWMQEVKAGELMEGEEGYEKQNISQCIAKLEVYLI